MRAAHFCKNYFIYFVLLYILYTMMTMEIPRPCEDVLINQSVNMSQEDNQLDRAKIAWAEEIIKNVTGGNKTVDTSWSNLYNAMPHLRQISPSALEPIFLLGSRPPKKKLIMAIPAVQRPKDSYLLSTLDSLIKFLAADDRKIISIMVFLSHEEGEKSDFAQKTTAAIKEKFMKEVDEGLLQVVVIPVLFYPPNLHQLSPTFNDSKQRMYWRTRQNIDYIYSMSYAANLADLYLQLEDDISAAKGYLKNILYFAEIKEDFPWAMLEFSSLGCIGKLIRSVDLYLLINSISMFYGTKPVDWIIDDLYKTMYCSPEWGGKRCRDEVAKYRLNYEPIQFQHMGKFSSLPGKIQRLKEKSFGEQNLRKKRDNPKANVESSMPAKEPSHSLSNAYHFSAYFMTASAPKQGDFISITFHPAVKLKAILLTTGHTKYPNYILSEEAKVYSTDDALQVQEIGHFTAEGRFFLRLSGALVKKIRVEIHENLNHTVILEQVAFTL